MSNQEARDLAADMAICEAATPGPWCIVGNSVATLKTDKDGWHDSIINPRTPFPSFEIMQFISMAREGWPYAIRLAQELQKENEQLERELQVYRDHERGLRGPWD
ncbi:hypothetical protein DFQ01_121113 [Paenibacillus cellulosilyticus]|uniref:Uncharacterized protein n=1 Tax=Paenibacillus cellulosilyticus TaxID=375489 RepID=A0A2V2YP96_9BACL|nr:hypothetical protein [Paenibacillus cellulosilyticus]PWV97469.1 hypothetical protein DFQ01_121113 [Paenibacillus cellulosilyticus]QKS48494.1 hypothetical protein HUB94_30125 [Paenibacillus cellulosilyticus]